jgi:hypothetical protein
VAEESRGGGVPLKGEEMKTTLQLAVEASSSTPARRRRAWGSCGMMLLIYDAATVWAKIPRVNNLTLTLDPIAGSPLMNAATDMTGTITGLSDVPSQFAVLLFQR